MAAIEAEGADEMLSGLQDDQRLIEVGDVEPRTGVADVRQAIGPVPERARQMLRTLGRCSLALAGRHGGVVTQRPAKPFTPVRFRLAPSEKPR